MSGLRDSLICFYALLMVSSSAGVCVCVDVCVGVGVGVCARMRVLVYIFVCLQCFFDFVCVWIHVCIDAYIMYGTDNVYLTVTHMMLLLPWS